MRGKSESTITLKKTRTSYLTVLVELEIKYRKIK